MNIWGKSESELKQFASELDSKEAALTKLESELKSREGTLAHERNLLRADKQQLEDDRSARAADFKRDAERIAAAQSELEKRRPEIALLEANAKASFADAQREAFEELFTKRQGALDSRQQHLDALTAELKEKLEVFHVQEADLARRTLAVTEREQKANAGFADKARTLAEEATRQHQANQAESGRLGNLGEALACDRQKLEEEKAALAARLQAVRTAENQRDNGYAEARAALEEELRGKRMATDSELTATRQKRLSDVEAEVAKIKAVRLADVSEVEETERKRIRTEIAKEREEWAEQQEDGRRAAQKVNQEIEEQKGQLIAQNNENERRKAELNKAEQIKDLRAKQLEGLWQKRTNELQDEIEARVADRRQSLELTEAGLRAEISRLRDALRIQTELAGAFEQLKRQLGNKDPAEIIRDLNSQTYELTELREELATRPTEEMRERYQSLEMNEKNQKKRADALATQLAEQETAIAEVRELRRQNSEIDAENKSLAQRAKRFEDAANAAQTELGRLRAAYERPAEIEARFKEIEKPRLGTEAISPPVKADVDEFTWLDGIGKACAERVNDFETAAERI